MAATEAKVTTENSKVDLFEDDDEFEEFETNQGNFRAYFFILFRSIERHGYLYICVMKRGILLGVCCLFCQHVELCVYQLDSVDYLMRFLFQGIDLSVECSLG